MWKLAPVFLEAAAIRNQNTRPPARSGSNPILYDGRGHPFQFSSHANSNSPASIRSSPLTQCFWTFFWLGLLIFIGWPIGLFACECYVFLSPLSVILPQLLIFTDLLFKVAQFPSICTRNMLEAKPIMII